MSYPINFRNLALLIIDNSSKDRRETLILISFIYRLVTCYDDHVALINEVQQLSKFVRSDEEYFFHFLFVFSDVNANFPDTIHDASTF